MTLAQDKARRINTPLSILHYLWLADMLEIPYKSGNGPDLYNRQTQISIEIKRIPKPRYPSRSKLRGITLDFKTEFSN